MDSRMEQLIGAIELSDIKSDEHLAPEALRNYLMRKYENKFSDFTVLSDEPELSFLSWDDGKPIVHEKLRYSGCRIAEIEIESRKAHVLYAVSDDTPEYRYGGMDDYESEAFGVEVANEVAKLFGERLVEAKIVAGRVVASEYGAHVLLSGRLSGNWIDVISDSGILNAELTFESKPENLEEVRNSLVSMFDGFENHHVVVVVRATFLDINSDDSFIWSNGK